MSAIPQRSTVVVHTVVDGKHQALVFSEVSVSHQAPSLQFGAWPDAAPTREDGWIVRGESGVLVEGGTAEEVGAKVIAFQSEKAARLRKERDDARRGRDAALREMAVLKANLLRIIDPDSFDDDDDDDGYCEQCNDYHDWGEEDQ